MEKRVALEIKITNALSALSNQYFFDFIMERIKPTGKSD